MSLASFNRARRLAAEKAAKVEKKKAPTKMNKVELAAEILAVKGQRIDDVDKYTKKRLLEILK